MMSKKDYERAAAIVQEHARAANAATTAEQKSLLRLGTTTAREAFVSLFRGDNPRFDVERFREACVASGVAKKAARA